MSITDELRKWAKGSTLSSWTAEHLTAIADRIDAEHERECKEQYACGVEHGIGASIDASMIQTHGYVELPVDADGVPIHIGDVMDSKVDYLFDGRPFYVRALVLCEDGWDVADGRFGNRYKPNSLRHHHAPTVEDVLREFAEKMNENLGMYTGEAIDADEWRSADAKTIAEYAKRLTLAEGEDA